MSGRRLLIVGAGETGEMAAEYFRDDTSYEVAGFAVERRWLEGAPRELMGLPVVALEDAPRGFPPNGCDAFVAVSYAHVNGERERLCGVAEGMGYRLATYVSSHACVGAGACVESGAMVMENGSVQRGARIGRGAFVWPGCVVSHRSEVGGFCWLAPGATVAGMSSVGCRSFLGAGCVVGDGVRIAERSLIGAGAVVTHGIDEPGCAWTGNPARKLSKATYERFCR